MQTYPSRNAIRLGIGMVPQHFMLIPNFSVAENLSLGVRTFGVTPVRLREMETRIKEFSQRFGLAVDPRAIVETLSQGERQRVEIVRALLLGARILILDEPTSVLTPGEVEPLLRTLCRLAEQGTSIILISHKIPEVLAVCQRITVLRNGVRVGIVDRDETDETALVRMMVGREVQAQGLQELTSSTEQVLGAIDLQVSNDQRHPVIRGVSLSLRRGEIFGLAGVDGNGQRELAEALAGIRRIDAGRVIYKGSDVTHLGVRARYDRGIAFMPSDRQKLGLVPGFTVEENLILDQYRHGPISRRGWLHLKPIRNFSSNLLNRFNIRGGNLDSLVRQLSGGNQQKVLLARVLSRDVDALIVSQPTSGLDIGATEFVRDLLLKLRAGGTAILPDLHGTGRNPRNVGSGRSVDGRRNTRHLPPGRGPPRSHRSADGRHRLCHGFLTRRSLAIRSTHGRNRTSKRDSGRTLPDRHGTLPGSRRADRRLGRGESRWPRSKPFLRAPSAIFTP